MLIKKCLKLIFETDVNDLFLYFSLRGEWILIKNNKKDDLNCISHLNFFN